MSTKKIGHINKAIQFEELESKKTTKCIDKDKQTLSAYDIKGKEKSSITSENK